MLQCIAVFTTLVTALVVVLHQAESCNEAVCGSVVSKCLLTQSCKCDLKNCTCCKECSACLSYLYSECCSCVDMCPKPNDTEESNLSTHSYVGELEKISGLFQVLTDEPDPQARWTTMTFPIQSDTFYFIQKKEIKLHMQSAEQEVAPIKSNGTTVINCTVAFMAQCMSWMKCKKSCQSMGASSYRWFHDGCCECVGDTCIDYGYKKSSCLKCPLNDDELIDDFDLTEDATYDDDGDADFEDETNDNENL
ncbi:protein twisted gastrulation [Agrilus planipennis]|uniref:Protein twisted gastrulation n=1 Tax=Agrilus planipennis TaxID=224129 RepID=A0A1W4W8Y7_AGRPL|nr:protein twisted gastrulation [Agrilus planipennis]XP_018320462.1 protein twisted gastrulation [Agrilus planipennis]